LLADDNPFSMKAQRGGPDTIGPALLDQTRHDLETLQGLFLLTGRRLDSMLTAIDRDAQSAASWDQFAPLGRGTPPFGPAGRALKRQLAQSADWTELVSQLSHFYASEGSGLFGRFRAFRWTRRGHGGHLEGIAYPDPIRLEHLIGYEQERTLLVNNTEQFLAGFPANNVLLYGERGTGKSSTVKALLNAYADRGLRLVEVSKQLLPDFPQILAALRDRRERFILFVDDLSFDEHETIYREMKAVLEGTLEARPENILVYATSNRRHLIVERFSDHDAPDEAEIHVMDTVQEKLSLSDRFGLRIFFISPDQSRYLQIVRGLAQQRELMVEPAVLERRALQWATWQNGRSGRTARQFVDHLTGELGRFSQTPSEGC
jgi:predicted AAA+ superfamily ATPase